MAFSEYLDNTISEKKETPIINIVPSQTESLVVNEDNTATGIPYLALGGVFTQGADNLSRFVDAKDKMQVQKALIDMFTLYPEVTDDMIAKLAINLEIGLEILHNEIYSIMSSFFNRGLFVKNPHHPTDPNELTMGIRVEMEHTDNPLISERIARDHLTEDSMYYTHLAVMEKQYQGES